MKLFKTHHFVILLLLPLLTIANTGKPTGKHTKEKTIQKEFKVLPSTRLEVWNKYGNVGISTWDNDKIVIEAHVIVNGNNEQNLTTALKEILLDFSADDNKKKVKVETKGLADIKLHKEIHYQIRVPRTCPLWITNHYGNVIIDDTDANVDIGVAYGSLIAGKLNGINSIAISYSQNTKIKFARTMTAYIYYADFKVEESRQLHIKKMQSSNISIGKIWSLTYLDCNYGTLEVDSITNGINGSSDYLITNIKSITGDLPIIMNAKYGSINIDKWNNKNVAFDLYGTRLTLGYSDTIPFDLGLNVKGCIIPTTVGALPKTVQDNLIMLSEKEYLGYHLKKKSERKLNIKIAKGILRFNKIENQ
jgi:hypothetical protein